jgi:hypothetical protein
MCEGGMTAMAAAISIASSALAYTQSAAQAKDQQQAEATARKNNALLKYDQITEQQKQANQKAANEELDVEMAARKAVASQRVASGESGLTGSSLERLEQGLAFKSQRDQERIEQNRQNTENSNRFETKAAELGGTTLGVRGTNPALAALSIGLSGASGAMSQYRPDEE